MFVDGAVILGFMCGGLMSSGTASSTCGEHVLEARMVFPSALDQ
jgi:hypothetical protein